MRRAAGSQLFSQSGKPTHLTRYSSSAWVRLETLRRRSLRMASASNRTPGAGARRVVRGRDEGETGAGGAGGVTDCGGEMRERSKRWDGAGVDSGGDVDDGGDVDGGGDADGGGDVDGGRDVDGGEDVDEGDGAGDGGGGGDVGGGGVARAAKGRSLLTWKTGWRLESEAGNSRRTETALTHWVMGKGP